MMSPIKEEVGLNIQTLTRPDDNKMADVSNAKTTSDQESLQSHMAAVSVNEVNNKGEVIDEIKVPAPSPPRVIS